MEELDMFIEKEKKENPQLKELVEVFFSTESISTRDTMFQKDITTLVENIKINENELPKIDMEHWYKKRKQIYYHFIRNGAGVLFMVNKKRSEMIYIQFLKFKQELKKLNKEQTTQFTKRMIELFNQACELKSEENQHRDHKEWIYFQIMIKEIERIKWLDNK